MNILLNCYLNRAFFLPAPVATPTGPTVPPTVVPPLVKLAVLPGFDCDAMKGAGAPGPPCATPIPTPSPCEAVRVGTGSIDGASS